MSRDHMSDRYSEAEKRDLIQIYGQELRDGDRSEAEFRIQLAKLGYNATDIDGFFIEAMKPT